jgi:hypothetical protein
MNEKLKFHKNTLRNYFLQKRYPKCSWMTLIAKSEQSILKQTQGGDLGCQSLLNTAAYSDPCRQVAIVYHGHVA